MECENKKCKSKGEVDKKLNYCNACLLLTHPIKYLRLCNKYSQKDFAKFLEIAQGTLSKIENDRLSPDIRTLNILRMSYSVDLNKLILDLNVRTTKGYES